MDYSYRTEEGHCKGSEDFIGWVKWKVADLKEQGFTYNEIINFEESYEWKKNAKIILGVEE